MFMPEDITLFGIISVPETIQIRLANYLHVILSLNSEFSLLQTIPSPDENYLIRFYCTEFLKQTFEYSTRSCNNQETSIRSTV
jgi:hypothetical protein